MREFTMSPGSLNFSQVEALPISIDVINSQPLKLRGGGRKVKNNRSDKAPSKLLFSNELEQQINHVAQRLNVENGGS